VAGLGNPGPRYSRTRHNAGFMLADAVRDKAEAAGEWKSWRELGEYCRAQTSTGQSFYILKPATYMNESGRMLSDFCHFYKIDIRTALICFDDMSLDLGRIRLRMKGSSGGQRGMESVIMSMSTEDIPRLRIGIGKPPKQAGDCKDFVLSSFSPGEWKTFCAGLETARQAVFEAVEHGVESAMNKFNAGTSN